MIVSLLALLSSPAQAGSCCVGATSPVPTRLGPCERALVGVAVRGEAGALRWDRRGAVRRSSMTEWGVEGTLAAGLGFSRRSQLSVSLPVRHTWRFAGELTGLGGGVGDTRIIGRYHARLEGRTEAGGTRPGVWVTAGARLPTGRSWDASTDVLLADVTGLPRPALSLGLIFERTQHRMPWVLTASTEVDAGAVVSTAQAGLGRTLGPRLTVLGAVGHTLSVVVDDGKARTSGRTQISGRAVLGRPSRFRAWTGLSADVPVPGLGREQQQLVRADLGIALVR